MFQLTRRTAISVLLAAGLLHCSSSDQAPGSGASGGTAGVAGAVAGAAATNVAGGGSGGSAESAGNGGNAGSTAGGGSSGAPQAGNGGAAAGADGSAGHSAGSAGSAGNGGGNAGSAGGAGGTPPYAPCPAIGSKCVIMPVGDSITAGYQSTTGGGYRLRLLQDIWAANHDATFVGENSGGPATLDGKPFPKANEGYSGYTIDNAPSVMRSGISPLVPAALTKYSPHIVLLMIGTNDMGTNNDVANAPTRLGKLLDSILTTSPKALLVVAQITPTGDDKLNVLVQAYNAAIPGLVKARADAGKHIILGDMYDAFTAHPAYRTDYMKDSLHPNDTGYAVMGDAWYALLKAHL